MVTDYHCHILPGIDDGAVDVEMSLKMLEMMKQSATQRVIATPHFYAHREKDVLHFLEKREKAYEKLMQANPAMDQIVLGAEVAIEKDLSELANLDQLRIQGTDFIMLELPYMAFADWMLEEIESIASIYKLTPIVAHIHRYLPYYSKSDYEKVLQIDAVFQINAEAFTRFREHQLVKKLIKNEFPLVFGSDAHNVSERKPDFEKVIKGLRKYPQALDRSYFLLEAYHTERETKNERF